VYKVICHGGANALLRLLLAQIKRALMSIAVIGSSSQN
jgi:hypothetical protein